MRKVASLLPVLMLASALVFGQARTLTGRVTDAQGNPVPFASVSIKGANTGVAADQNGNYTIQAAPNATLVISAAGFQSYEVGAGSQSTVNVTLSQNIMSEVVVTALGIQRQRKDLGYATARVASAELTQAAPVNVANGLAGKVSGLNITNVNNNVQGDVKITLRGIRSLTGNNNPMLLLDGVQTPLSFLNSINPNDIQDVTVLKGSSSAGIYGPDAVNGVIVVTTKKGTRGNQPVITLSQTVQAERVAFFPKFQTQFGSGGYGEYIPYENWSWGPAYDGSTVEAGDHLEDGSVQTLTYSPLKDERKKFFNTGLTNQTDVSFGVKDFYLSLQDVRISGVTPDDKNRRTGVRLNTSREYGRFRVNFGANYIQQNYNVFDQIQMEDYNVANNVGLNGGLLNLIFNTPAHIPITSYKDFTNNKFADYNGYFNNYGLNPYFAIDNWRENGKNDDMLTNLELNFKAADWLNFTYRAAAQIRATNIERTSKGEVPSPYAADHRGFVLIPGAALERSYRNSRLSSEFFANFNKTFGDFKVNAIAGHYLRQNDTRDNRVNANNLVVPELFNVGNRTGELTGSNSVTRSRLVSAFGSVGLGYKGWANIEFTGRNDWTSLLAIGNNSYFYPGVNASLVLSDALDLTSGNFPLSYLKVRGAWNKTGNANIEPYRLAALYEQTTTSGFPFGSLPGFTAQNAAYDALLRPEFVESKEVGLEASFLKNRINMEVAYFHQDNTDQIIPIAVSSATGYTTSNINAASFVNKGIELDLRLTPLVRLGNVDISFKANATYNNSEVKSIYGELPNLFIGGFNNLAANFAVVNKPAFIFRLTDYQRDDQGHIIVDAETGYPSEDPNLKDYGRTMPLWMVGLSPTISWKGLSFTALAEYKGGHYAYHSIGSDMAWTGVSAATARNSRERFVIPNSVYMDASGKYVPNTSVAVQNVNDFYTGVFRDVASNFITSASSWRLREVSLGYRIPVSIFGNQKVVKAANLTLNARNLFLWLPESNEFTDPDFNFAGGANSTNAPTSAQNASGVNTSQIYPPTRMFGANLTLTF